jgi:dihydrofolate reductase
MSRRIIAYNNVSADGYFTAEGGRLDWIVPDDELDRSVGDNLTGVGTILFGRKTYDMFEAFWPNALHDSAPPRNPHGGGRSMAMHRMAVWINGAEKLVFSRSRQVFTWNNSRLLGAFDAKQIETLKAQSGRDIMLFGSGTIASQLDEHGLIDDYTFVVSPVLLGGGRSLLSGVSRRQALTLGECRTYDSGIVLLRYHRA